MDIALTLNGEPRTLSVDPQETLLDLLRDRLGLSGVKRSCEVQVCGACTVLVDGLPVSSCCYLACETADRSVMTIEGFRGSGAFVQIQDAFTRHAAVQCGFCTPAMVLTVYTMLEEGTVRSDEQIRDALAGNLCRCTGYRSIIAAVHDLATADSQAVPPDSRG